MEWIEYPEYIEQLMIFFLQDPKGFSQIIPQNDDPNSYFRVYIDEGRSTARISLNALGALLTSSFKIESVNFRILIKIMNWSENDHLFQKFYGFPDIIWDWSTDMISHVMAGSSLAGAIGGKKYFINKIQNSVAEVRVDNVSGDTFTGTAFLYKSVPDHSHFMTCKHNLIDENGEVFKNIRIRILEHEIPIDQFNASDRVDLATIHLTPAIPESEPLWIVPAFLGEEVISAGYPRTHLLRESPLLIHSGEINGFSKDPANAVDEIIMSCNVGPGNSGGPLLNIFGSVVGMVHQEVEAKLIDNVAKYSFALPLKYIYENINDYDFWTYQNGKKVCRCESEKWDNIDDSR